MLLPRRRLLAALICLAPCLPLRAVRAAPAAPPAPADAPAGYLLLVHGGPLCGEGHNYYVPKDRYKPQELDWARQTFGFIYHYRKGLDYPYILEYIADYPLSQAQADALFKTTAYLDWLGPHGQAAMHAVGEARELCIAHAAAARPADVAAFRQARRAARTWLIDKMELEAKADKTAC